MTVMGDYRTPRSAPRRRAGAFGAPPSRNPRYAALRECLRAQSEGPTLGAFSRIFGMDPLARSAQRSYQGALAELEVVRALDALGEEWTVLHSVPSGDGALIDHLAIGPAGVFAIGIRNHAGQRVWVGERTFMADNERLDYLAHFDELALSASLRLTEASDVALPRGTVFDTGPESLVTPCIVIDAPGELLIGQRASRTEVVAARTFASWLAALPRLLSPVVVETLSAAAVDEDTWPESHPSADVTAALHDFARLQRRVSTARLRRLVWTGLGVIVSYATVFASFGGMSLFGLLTLLTR
jgi:hypothetical protein